MHIGGHRWLVAAKKVLGDARARSVSKLPARRFPMTWYQRYLIRSYLLYSIWIFPAIGIVVAIATIRLTNRAGGERSLNTGASPEAARALLLTLAASMFTCIVFTSTTLLLAVQLASATLTPRVISLIFRD